MVFFLLPGSWQNQWQVAIGAASVAAIVIGTRRNRPQNPSAWYAMAFGQLLFVAGDAYWAYYEVVLHRESPFPSYADVAYVAGYVPLAVGLALVVRARRPGHDVYSILDAAIVTVAAAVGSWIFLMAPQTVDATDPVATLVSISYPIADVLLLAVAARLVFTADTRAFSYRLIVASLFGLIAADTLYIPATISETYKTGSALDAGWLFSYVLWGTAALHPSMRKLTERNKNADPPRFTRRRLTVNAIAVAAIPLMWAVQRILGAPSHSGVVIGGATIAALLVIARMGGLMEALESAALHDSLTGLPNRRLLLDRIGQAFRRSERTGAPLAIVFIDLGGFKKVNDRYGHDAGDQALIEIGRRIRGAVRTSDTVARLGGDEFVILCEGIDQTDGETLMQRVRRDVSEPIDVNGQLVEINVDLGIAFEMVPAEGNASQLLVAADRAMYHAKQAAKQPPRS
jgi:diguanylate cyclase (GGDEF)-like protein